jgi:hypothetical protein
MQSPRDITNTYADWLEQLEQAVYDGCGPNVGPEEFDEAASRACAALNGLKRCNRTRSERADRILKTASEVFGNYIRR